LISGDHLVGASVTCNVGRRSLLRHLRPWRNSTVEIGTKALFASGIGVPQSFRAVALTR
jgi:hypothetical protein